MEKPSKYVDRETETKQVEFIVTRHQDSDQGSNSSREKPGMGVDEMRVINGSERSEWVQQARGQMKTNSGKGLELRQHVNVGHLMWIIRGD